MKKNYIIIANFSIGAFLVPLTFTSFQGVLYKLFFKQKPLLITVQK